MNLPARPDRATLGRQTALATPGRANTNGATIGPGPEPDECCRGDRLRRAGLARPVAYDRRTGW